MAVRAAGWLRSRADAWRSGSVRAQWWLAATLVLLILLSLVVSLVNHNLMPLTAYFLWLLIARILLSFRPLVVVATVNAIAGSLAILLQPNGMEPVRWVAVVEFLLASLLVLYVAGRLRSGLPVHAQRGAAREPPRPAAGAGPDAATARGLAVADRDDRLARGQLRRGLPGGRPARGPGAGGDPGRRLRQGHRRRAGGAAVRGRAGWADRRAAARGAVPRGQRLPAPPERRRGLRHRGAPARRPRERHLPDHQRRATRPRCASTCPPASG